MYQVLREKPKKQDFTKIPIFGLAKKEEWLYPLEGEPIKLPKKSLGLRLLQKIRDESHRFANTYNARLRLKKISESVLDEFPGIGDQRKAALLKRFGSVQRMTTASAEIMKSRATRRGGNDARVTSR